MKLMSFQSRGGCRTIALGYSILIFLCVSVLLFIFNLSLYIWRLPLTLAHIFYGILALNIVAGINTIKPADTAWGQYNKTRRPSAKCLSNGPSGAPIPLTAQGSQQLETCVLIEHNHLSLLSHM